MSIIFKLDGKNVKQGQEEQTKRRTKDKDNIICSKSSSINQNLGQVGIMLITTKLINFYLCFKIAVAI